MKIKKKIGWQKFEDLIESQLTSPVMDRVYKAIYSQYQTMAEEDFTEEELEMMQEMMDAEEPSSPQTALPIDQKTLDNISMASNFDCWMGHTNFNITQDTLDNLNKMEGVEILKICSRYRFFIGIGRMFDFKEVRQSIEDSLTKEQELEE